MSKETKGLRVWIHLREVLQFMGSQRVGHNWVTKRKRRNQKIFDLFNHCLNEWSKCLCWGNFFKEALQWNPVCIRHMKAGGLSSGALLTSTCPTPPNPDDTEPTTGQSCRGLGLESVHTWLSISYKRCPVNACERTQNQVLTETRV